MDISITAAIVAAIVTGIVTGLVSTLGTIGAMNVHIQYIRETLMRHDNRLRDIELENREIRDLIRTGRATSLQPAPHVVEKPITSKTS